LNKFLQYLHSLLDKINKIQLANLVWSFLFKTARMGIAVFTGIYESVWLSEKGGGSFYHVENGGDDGEESG
jgi:hypothetical protein